ncbi:glycosyltransferase [Lacticaseibacillus jixianensis]|uniref:Glycosyltransferase n=1 Tax=Lacticaseibacillus jixianensis TaxID=2486012 RepID=A0ABW4B815_9LACO|nr:glycosyltransferase [Lacticaseibacillus jixianensis]
MRILHISRTMGQGGAEKIVYQLCRDNKEQDQIVISSGGVYVPKLKRLGIAHVTMPDIDSKNPFTMVACFLKIWLTIRKYKIQLVHTHHRMAAFYARIISALTGIPTVYTAHNIFTNRRSLVRFSLKETQIVAVGQGVKKNLEGFYGINPDSIQVVYNSVSVHLSGSRNNELARLRSEGKCLVGSIGRLTKQKGMDVFIDSIALARKKNPAIVGVIIGDGDDKEALRQQVASLNLNNYIIFLGYQSHIYDIIDQLDFVVLSSRWEGLPLIPIEVFSQAKAMIASDIPGNNELIENNQNGLLAKKESSIDFANAILRLASSKELRVKIGNKAKESYINNYQYKKFIDGYNEIYYAVLKRLHRS